MPHVGVVQPRPLRRLRDAPHPAANERERSRMRKDIWFLLPRLQVPVNGERRLLQIADC